MFTSEIISYEGLSSKKRLALVFIISLIGAWWFYSKLGVTEKRFREGCAAYAQSFERSNVLDLAGQPSSNSRIINLMARFTDTLTPRESEFYLFYAQLIRVFSSNCVVEQ